MPERYDSDSVRQKYFLIGTSKKVENMLALVSTWADYIRYLIFPSAPQQQASFFEDTQDCPQRKDLLCSF